METSDGRKTALRNKGFELSTVLLTTSSAATRVLFDEVGSKRLLDRAKAYFKLKKGDDQTKKTAYFEILAFYYNYMDRVAADLYDDEERAELMSACLVALVEMQERNTGQRINRDGFLKAWEHYQNKFSKYVHVIDPNDAHNHNCLLRAFESQLTETISGSQDPMVYVNVTIAFSNYFIAWIKEMKPQELISLD